MSDNNTISTSFNLNSYNNLIALKIQIFSQDIAILIVML